MMKNTIWKVIFLSLTVFYSCQKERDFLNNKPDQSLVIPTTLGDYERLLNDQFTFNLYTDQVLGTASADEYYVPDDVLNSSPADYYRTLYIWDKDIEQSSFGYESDWNSAYKQIFQCNVVLEGIGDLPDAEKSGEMFDIIKGRALFLRSWAFYNLVQTYAMPYDPATAKNDLGIPLRLSSNINQKSVRASVQECYDQIIFDLGLALSLLPDFSVYKTHPSGVATLGFLSRVYLAMGYYEKAFEYADLFLSKYDLLTDYNILSTSRKSSINTTFLDEDVFHTSMSTSSPSTRTRARIPDEIYNMYHENDLRRTRFFRLDNGEIFFKGSYDYFGYHYSGIATDEIYLIRAECFARMGKTVLALKDLNHLLQFRWDNNISFLPMEASSADLAISIILEERKKELLFRGTRWTDLRRLNREERFKTTIRRVMGGKEYTLPPNDPRYAMPIPKSEIELSNIEQNER